MLRHVLTDYPQRDFTDFLPMCQYAFNTAEHAALKMSPYFASWGSHPRNPTMFRADTSGGEIPAVEEFVSHQVTVLHQVKDALFQAQRTMEEFENRGRQEVSMSVGDKVFLNTRNLS